MVRLAALGAAALGLAIVIGVLSAAPWPASGYRHTDFFQFWAAPEALLEGRSPYERDWYVTFAARVGSRALEFWPDRWVSPYPLWTDLVTLPLALLPYPVATAAWLVAQVVAMAGGLAAIGMRAYRSAPLREGVVVAGIAIGFEPVWGVIGGGNIAGLAAGFMAGAAAASGAGRTALAGGFLGLLLVKPQLAVTIIPIFFALAPREEWRRLAGGLLGVGAVMAVASVAVRPRWPLEWARSAVVEQVTGESNASVWTIDRLLPAGLAGPVVPLLIAAAVVGCAAVWYRRARPARPTALAAGIALALFIAPHVRHYDQVLLLVTIALLVARFPGLVPRVRVPAVVVVAMTLIVVPWVLYAVAVSRGVTRAVPDLHEEWSAITPLVALALVIAVDLVAAGARRTVSTPAAR